jgi:hypothetical protein
VQYKELEKTKQGCEELIEKIKTSYKKNNCPWHENIIPQ